MIHISPFIYLHQIKHKTKTQKHRKGKEDWFIKYNGLISFHFMYDFNNSHKNKRFTISNDRSFNVEYNGNIHSFKINLYKQKAIAVQQWVPGAANNGIKVNKNCILRISSPSGIIGRLKLFCSKHGDKFCIIYLSQLEVKINDMFVYGHRNKDILRALEVINSRKMSEEDEEGKIYFNIPSFGIYIKKTN